MFALSARLNLRRPGARSIALAFLLLLAPGQAVSDEVLPYAEGETPRFDWYYAAAFGTGRYSAGERTVTALRVPLAWELKREEEARARVRLLAPVTLGAVDFGLEGVIDDPLDSVSMLMFTPGVELQWPVGDQWRVRSFAYVGGGVEFEGDDRAWIYAAGVSARRDLPCQRIQCRLGLALTWAGFNSSQRSRDDMSNVSAGLDVILPGATEGFHRLLHPGFFLIYRNYFSGVEFIFDPRGVGQLGDEWEVGMSMNANRPFSVFGLRFDRLGVSYRRSGELRGVHLTGQFPF